MEKVCWLTARLKAHFTSGGFKFLMPLLVIEKSWTNQQEHNERRVYFLISISLPVLSVLFALLLLGCSRNFSEQMNEIKVGMTYEEVENTLGKPQQISRGFKKLNVTTRTTEKATFLALEELLSRIDDPSDTNASFGVEFMLNYPDTVSIEIEAGGDLMYVCWEYDLASMRIDTIVFRDVPKIVSDTSYVSGVKYFGEWKGRFEKEEISKEMYHKYFSALRRARTTEFGRAASDELTKGLTVWSEKAQLMQFSNYRVEKKWKAYIITYKQFVLFDASSGRVTTVDYQPIDCLLRY